jgi:RNA-binding protein
VADGLLEQVEHNLLAAELVKVKVLNTCPQPLAQIATALAGSTGARVAQTIGRTLVLYRPHPEAPAIRLPP